MKKYEFTDDKITLPVSNVLNKSIVRVEIETEKDVLIDELLQAVKELVHEQCQLTCKDHDKECEPTCWVLKHKQLIDRVKGGAE